MQLVSVSVPALYMPPPLLVLYALVMVSEFRKTVMLEVTLKI